MILYIVNDAVCDRLAGRQTEKEAGSAKTTDSKNKGKNASKREIEKERI